MSKVSIWFFLVFFNPVFGFAQSTLKQLLEISTANYPELQAKRLESEAAGKVVQFEKSGLIPTLNASYQALYSTNNNITGMFLPGNIMPISGPPNIENSYDMTYGSAAALLMTWSPFTFGKRDSYIQNAQYKEEISRIQEQLTLLEHQVRFVEAYLNFWEAASVTKATEENKNRVQTGLDISKNLVSNGLRPGVDSAQFRSMLVRSKIEFLQAKRNEEALEARVRELLGEDDTDIVFDQNLENTLNSHLEESSGTHPLLLISRANTQLSVGNKNELNRSLLPDLNFWGTTYARGSAIQFDGSVINPTDGLNFSKYNYGFGFQISMPILQFARTNKLVQRQDYLISAAEAYQSQVERALEKELTVAKVTLQTALESSQIAPEYVLAADYTYQALKSRYDAGLIDLNELLQGQVDLAKAEADSIRVKADMWKSLLYYAAVNGDMDFFIQYIQ